MPGSRPEFPDPRHADAEGLIAVGGDLSVPRLLAAYRTGVFPWFDESTPPLWWSPDPRGVIVPERLHVSRRLARLVRREAFRLTWDKAFAAVMRACGTNRSDGTWIVPDMLAAYTAMHLVGHAHSVEVWLGNELVGGLYGVQIGGLFAAESMFRRVDDASKVALVAAVRSLSRAGIELIDVQFVTRHLARFGAERWRRKRYLDALSALVAKPVDLAGMVVEV